MTPARRTAPALLSSGLLALAVVAGAGGLATPAHAAAPAVVRAAADAPLAPTLETSAAELLPGRTVLLGGFAPSVPGASSRPDVAIQARVGDAAQWTRVATAESRPNGTFVAKLVQGRTTEYRAVPIDPVSGNVRTPLTLHGAQVGASEPVTVSTVGTVSLAVKRTAARAYTFSGTSTPGTAGQAVTVQAKKGASWVPVAAAVTRADGTWAVKATMTAGKRSMRAVSATSADGLGAVSTARTVVVR